MSEMLHGRVLWKHQGAVATATLARPDAGNAIDGSMAAGLFEMAERIHRGAEDGSIRAVLITAKGRAFCLGGDLAHVAAADEEGYDRGVRLAALAATVHDMLRLVTAAPIPVVTAVQGVAAGAGVGVALAGDVVLASTKAGFRMAYTAAGLSPDCGTSWLLPRRVGLARALDLGLTNRLLRPAEAEQWGLVSRLVPPDELAAKASRLVETLADGPTQAFAETKRLMRGSTGLDLTDQMDDEAMTIARLANGAEGRHGVDVATGRRAAVPA